MSDRVTVDALALRARLEEQLGREANVQAQRIVDDLIREQARAGGHLLTANQCSSYFIVYQLPLIGCGYS